MKKTLTTLSLTAFIATQSYAAISFTGTTINQDFTGFDGLTAPTGWDASGLGEGPGFTEMRGDSTGGVSTGGTYAFDIGSGNTALGVQPVASDFTPGYYQLQITNDTGLTVESWKIGFTSYYYNDQNRANSFNFSYSTDNLNFTDVATASFTSPKDKTSAPSWIQGTNYDDTVVAAVSNGGNLYLRWGSNDVNGSGSRDEFALDDVTLTSVPEPSSTALLGLGGLALLAYRKK